MSGGYGADPELMRKAAHQIDEVRHNVDSALRQLDSQIAPLGSVWKGQASTAFQRLMQLFHENANTITNKLGEIGHNVQRSGANYGAQEQEHHENLSKVQSHIESVLGGH